METNNKQENSTRRYLYGHESQETAYVVQNYPWGFRLRTTIRYWIESKDAKNGGQRFCSQTIDPKTGRWCAPKKTTYSPVIFMFLDENDHVQWDCLSMYSSGLEDHKTKIERWLKIHEGNLTEFQKDQFRIILAYHEVYKHVTVTFERSPIGPVSLFSNDPVEIEKRKAMIAEQEERKKERDKNEQLISRAINREYVKNKTRIV